MKTLFVCALGVIALLAASPSSAQTPKPTSPNRAAPVPAASQSLTTRAFPTNPPLTKGEARPLFHIGNMPVLLWAPIQPPYDSHMNRNLAENPIWNENAF